MRALRVLTVEDHADMRTSLGILFKFLGCQARFSSTLASARVAAREEHFDVLLSDINLPDGDGWDLLRELKELDRLPGVAIAMSGFCCDKDIAASLAAGFDVHLIKPFTPRELTGILQSAADALPEKQSRSASKRKLAWVKSDGGPSAMVRYPFV